MGQNLKDFISENCQVHENLWRSESFTRRLRRKFIYIYRHLVFIYRKFISKTNHLPKVVSNSQRWTTGVFHAGEIVRVRSLGEIKGQLDSMSRTGGCTFVEPMARYCGQEVKILRRVNRFFDEAQLKMLRSNKLVILEDCKCDGSQRVLTEGCDRTCYYFWREEWLEPLGHKDGHLN